MTPRSSHMKMAATKRLVSAVAAAMSINTLRYPLPETAPA